MCLYHSQFFFQKLLNALETWNSWKVGIVKNLKKYFLFSKKYFWNVGNLERMETWNCKNFEKIFLVFQKPVVELWKLGIVKILKKYFLFSKSVSGTLESWNRWKLGILKILKKYFLFSKNPPFGCSPYMENWGVV